MRKSPLLSATITALPLLAGCFGKAGEPDYGDCPDYIACSDATGTPTATLEAQFGEDGICWDEDDDAQRLCRAQCTDAMDALSQAYPGVDECSGAGGSSSDDHSCEETPVPTGFDRGDVAYDFTLSDQHGDSVSLYDYCGDAVILLVGAGWDAGTGPAADQAAGWTRSYAGLTVMVLLGENEDSETPSAADLADFAEDHDLSGPVLADPSFQIGTHYAQGGLPSFTLMGPGAALIKVDQSSLSSADIEGALP